LWRLYQRRGKKGRDHAFASRLGFANILERVDPMRLPLVAKPAGQAHTLIFERLAGPKSEE